MGWPSHSNSLILIHKNMCAVVLNNGFAAIQHFSWILNQTWNFKVHCKCDKCRKKINKTAEGDKTVWGYISAQSLARSVNYINALFGLERLTFSHYKSSSSAQWAATATYCPILTSQPQSVSFQLGQKDTEFTIRCWKRRIELIFPGTSDFFWLL